MIQEQYIDLAGKIRITYKSSQTENIYIFKFDLEPSIETLESLCATQDYQAYLNSLEIIDVVTQESKQIVKDAIIAVLESEEVTLESYVAYLETLSWQQKAVVQYYMHYIANVLNTKELLILEDGSEESILIAMITYLNSKSLDELCHIFKLN